MHKLKHFDDLYARVTDALRLYVVEANRTGDLSDDEARWFNGLIEAFLARYQLWWQPQHPDPQIERYLARFDRWSVPAEVRLAGHAFLHIGYDLPIAMADMLYPDPAAQARQGLVFVRPGPLFAKVCVEFVKSGDFGPVRRFLPARALRLMSFWVLALRTTAWIHAGLLAYESGSRRDGMMAQMAVELDEAARRALEERWIWGIEELSNAELVKGTPAAFAFTPIAPAWYVVPAAAVMAAWWYRRKRINATIQVLGALVHAGLHHAVSGGTDDQRAPSGRGGSVKA